MPLVLMEFWDQLLIAELDEITSERKTSAIKQRIQIQQRLMGGAVLVQILCIQKDGNNLKDF